MTKEPKRKVSVTLDADLVAEIEAEGEENISALVNSALRVNLEKRRRHRALGELLRAMDEEEGPLDTAEDEAEILRIMQLLGGPAQESV